MFEGKKLNGKEKTLSGEEETHQIIHSLLSSIICYLLEPFAFHLPECTMFHFLGFILLISIAALRYPTLTDGAFITRGNFLSHSNRAFHHTKLKCFAYALKRRRVITSISKIDPYPNDQESDINEEVYDERDTIRVRIWKALSSGDELTLKELGSVVGERKLGDLRDHLSHVEKQAKTLKNKSEEWRKRRGLETNNRKIDKLRLIIRRGKKNNTFVRLG